MTAAWGSRRQLVELRGGPCDGTQFRVEELPEAWSIPEVFGEGAGVRRLSGAASGYHGPPLVYRRTGVVRESDGAMLYDLDR